MSRIIEESIERLQHSEFIFDNPEKAKELEVRQAVLLFTNFAGRANKFNNTAKNFNLVITPEVKDFLESGKTGLKVNVHTYKKSDDEPELYYINVKVNMLVTYPPSVTLYTDYQGQKTKTSLTDTTIGCLDRIDMERADAQINIKESKAREGYAVFYLKKLNVVQIKNPEFGGAYEDWDDPLSPGDEIDDDSVTLAEGVNSPF